MFDLKFYKMINNSYTRLTKERKIEYINDNQVRNKNKIIKLDTKNKFIQNYCELTPECNAFTEYFNSFVLYFNLIEYVNNFKYKNSTISNHCYSIY